MQELSSSELKSMLKFGAQCCFQSSEPPSDAMIDTIIDRNRKEGPAPQPEPAPAPHPSPSPSPSPHPHPHPHP